MIKSGMFNSREGDRKYDAREFAAYFAMFIGNGVFPNPANGLQVMSNGNMNIVLKAGKAWIHGYYLVNDDNHNMTLDVADGVLNRIDRVVLRLDYLNRKITPLVKKGTFASSPVAPSLKRDADGYEIALADIYVGRGILSITQANITDLRLNKDLCGIVHGVVDQVDTTAVFNQYQSWYNIKTVEFENEFNSWTIEKQQEFAAWFETIRDLLDGDVAGNLSNRITEVDLKVNQHKANTIVHITSEERSSWNGKTDNTNFVAHDTNYVKHPIFVTASGNTVTGAYTATIDPLPQYVDGIGIIMKVTTSTSVKATLNINGLGAKPICMSDGVQVDSLQAGGIYSLRYNASTGAFILQGEGGIEKPGEFYVINDAREMDKSIDHNDPNFKKLREILVLKSGKYRVSYDFHAGYHQYANAKAQIYINDEPTGLLRKTWETSHITIVEDLYVKKGDRVQLYGHGYGSVYTRNFKLGVLPFGEIITV